MDQKELTEIFRKLGAEDPEDWARSQIKEGIPQLARFLFLRQAWRCVVPEDDPGWIDETISMAVRDPNEEYAGAGHALASLRKRGATDEELTDLVRGTQAELLFQICCLLDDPGDLAPGVANVNWALVQTDDEGNVLKTIGGLHESVIEMDPTGREMRPRGAG